MHPLPHGDDALVAFGPRGERTARDLRRTAARVAAAHPGTGPVVVACADRFHVAAAVLGLAAAGRIARLPTSLAPTAVADAADGAPMIDDASFDTFPRVDAAPRLPPLAPSALFVELTTSGSTGRPSRHGKTVGQLLGEATTLARTFDVPDGARVVATVPSHHVYGLLFAVLLPLVRGGAFATDAPLMHEALSARIQGAGATLLVTVPAHLRALSRAPTGAFEGLDRVFSSGAPLPAAVAAAFAARADLPVTEVFGSTETGGIAWRHRADGEAWTPLPGVTVTTVDERLALDSPFLAPDTPRPHLGDDVVTLLDDGRFLHRGRRDDVVKIASKRVRLSAVEAALRACPGVRDAAVLALPDPSRHRTVLHGFVVGETSIPAVRASLADRLDAVAIPRLHALDALPRTDTGKLPRRALVALLPDPQVVVPSDHPGFDGHFPGHPVLPAVVQLHELVVQHVAARWPDLGPLRTMGRVKFRRPVTPGQRLRVVLTRDGDASRVRFALHDAAEVVTQGVADFTPSPEDPR